MARLRLANPEPSLAERPGRCRDWTGGTYRFLQTKGLQRDYGEGTVQTTNASCVGSGGESRSGMNPGAVGSNPAADTNLTLSH